MANRRAFGPPVFRYAEFRETEIENLHPTIFGHEEVLRFQVSVNDPFLMCRGQSLRNLHRVVNGTLHRERASSQPITQCLPFQKLGNDIGSVFVQAELMDHQQIWMVQHPRGTRFLLEALEAVLIFGYGGRQDLDCHLATDSGVASAVHLPHAADAK